MPKIVINTCFGGFGLSRKALDMYCEEKGIDPGKWNKTWEFYEDFSDRDIERDDPILIRIVEELEEESWGKCAELAIVDIPDGVNWYIDEYDGNEHVAERHRTWR